MASDKTGDWQEQLREMLRAQQDAYAFTSKLLADQSRFLEALSKAMGVPDKQS